MSDHDDLDGRAYDEAEAQRLEAEGQQPVTLPQAITAVEQAAQPTTIESMIVRAIDKGVSVETMERLLVMRRELKAEMAKELFDRAMAAFQRECPAIKKTKAVPERNSDRVRYSYAPVESIIAQTKEIIAQHGFSYTVDAEIIRIDGQAYNKDAKTSVVETRNWVRAICKVTHVAGHSQCSRFEVPIDKDSFMSEPQKFAAALTFAKRYAFISAFGIMTTDDDNDGDTRNSTNQNASPSRQDGSGTTNAPREAPRQPPPVKPRLQVTEDWKNWWLKQLDKDGLQTKLVATEFYQVVEPSGLLPNETLADLPLTHCPASVEQGKDLLEAIHRFGAGDKAEMPWPLNVPPTSQPLPKGKEPEKPGEGSYTASGPVDPDDPNAPWRAFPVPFGKNAGVTLSKLDKGTLFGFWANFTVEETYNGRPRSPEKIATDTQFRAMLDEAGKHYSFTKKD